jgi:hypothetical protein
MPIFREICRRILIEVTAPRIPDQPVRELNRPPMARLAIPQAAFNPLRTPPPPQWAPGWDYPPSPFRRGFTPLQERRRVHPAQQQEEEHDHQQQQQQMLLEFLPRQRSATPEPQGVAAILQQRVSPFIRAITPVRLGSHT